MNNGVMNWWNKRSDEYYGGIHSQLERLKADPSWAFPPVIWDMIRESIPDLQDKRILVPSSGDNFAVFAFHLLGAKVTSCDIAERQLYNAKKIADSNGWDIELIRQDSMELDKINDDEFDLVYTSNGVHVWISDLMKMYRNFHRVLKSGGYYIMFETHPFIRPFDDSGSEIIVKKPYEQTNTSSELIQMAWRIMDIYNAIQNSGLNVIHMEEFHPNPDEYNTWFHREPTETLEEYAKKYDWKQNPWAALPQWIGFKARKECRIL